jgi:predicted RNase H-like HicB family nuclease
MKGIYAAVFEPEDGKVYVSFPDLPGCITSGEDMNEAYAMAVDASNLWMTSVVEDHKQPAPKATPIDQVEYPEGARVMLIQIDTVEYLRKTETKAVRRSVSIPAWMDDQAQRRGISLSKTLQEALRLQLA